MRQRHRITGEPMCMRSRPQPRKCHRRLPSQAASLMERKSLEDRIQRWFTLRRKGEMNALEKLYGNSLTPSILSLLETEKKPSSQP